MGMYDCTGLCIWVEGTNLNGTFVSDLLLKSHLPENPPLGFFVLTPSLLSHSTSPFFSLPYSTSSNVDTIDPEPEWSEERLLGTSYEESNGAVDP